MKFTFIAEQNLQPNAEADALIHDETELVGLIAMAMEARANPAVDLKTPMSANDRLSLAEKYRSLLRGCLYTLTPAGPAAASTAPVTSE